MTGWIELGGKIEGEREDKIEEVAVSSKLISVRDNGHTVSGGRLVRRFLRAAHKAEFAGNKEIKLSLPCGYHHRVPSVSPSFYGYPSSYTDHQHHDRERAPNLFMGDLLPTKDRPRPPLLPDRSMLLVRGGATTVRRRRCIEIINLFVFRG